MLKMFIFIFASFIARGADIFQLSNPWENYVFYSTSATLRGVCTPGSTVSISGNGLSSTYSAICDNNSTFAKTVTLSSGSGFKNIAFNMLTLAGVKMDLQVNVYLRSTSARLKFSSPVNNSKTFSSATSLKISGFCIAGTDVRLREVTNNLSPDTRDLVVPCSATTGAFSAMVKPLVPGKFRMEAYQEFALTNSTAVSNPMAYKTLEFEFLGTVQDPGVYHSEGDHYCGMVKIGTNQRLKCEGFHYSTLFYNRQITSLVTYPSGRCVIIDDGNSVNNVTCDNRSDEGLQFPKYPFGNAFNDKYLKLYFTGGEICAVTATNKIRCNNSSASYYEIANSSSDPILKISGSCFLTSLGELKCWQAGNGTITNKIFSGGSGVKSFTANFGGQTGCAVFTDGSLKCWGKSNYFKFLGLIAPPGDYGGNYSTNQMVTIASLPAPAKSVVINSYGNSACALLTNGTVACWGSNNKGYLGQIGILQENNSTPVPTLVDGLTGVTELFAGVSIYAENFCAVISGTSIKCWGAEAVQGPPYGAALKDLDF